MKKNLWIVPALASAAFGAFTLQIVFAEGLFGFLGEKFQSGWGLQVLMDLFISLFIGLCLAVPYAKKLGIRPAFWVVLTATLGSVGFLAFAARLLYARGNGIPSAPVSA